MKSGLLFRSILFVIFSEFIVMVGHLILLKALELIPVAPTGSEISDPTGLIPGSVPFPPPGDPEDGFYRVNPSLLDDNDTDPSSTLNDRSEDSSEEISEPPNSTTVEARIHNELRLLSK